MGKMSPKAPSLPPPPPPIPEKKSVAEVKAKKQDCRAIFGEAAHTRGLGATINTSGTGEPKARLRHNVQRFSATNT